MTTKKLHERGFVGAVWQRSFYDHVVRDEADYLRIMEYINNNPAKWAEDRFYSQSWISSGRVGFDGSNT